MATFFTSDTHFGHKNILTLGNGRAFNTIEAHDFALIKLWNQKISPEDTIYHLGDVSHGMQSDQNRLDRLLSELNGEKFLIPGNHDITKGKDNEVLEILHHHFTILPLIHMLSVEGQSLVLCHYPLLEWPRFYRGAGCWHLHGHQHGFLNNPKTPLSANAYRLDVGVDSWEFSPVSMQQLKKHFSTVKLDIKKYFGGIEHSKTKTDSQDQ